MALQKLQIYVNDELWVFDVSDTEFQAATSGDEKVIKLLVDRESERRSMAVINEELQADEPGEPADASQANEARKESFVWPDKAVLLFLKAYRDKEPDFASGLKRHNKIWMEIASEMKAKYNVTAAQCQNKMSGLKRIFKNISDSNNKSGNHSSSWAFYSVMDSIFGEKAWIAPASIASSDGPSSPGSSSSTLSEKFAAEKNGWNQFWNRSSQKSKKISRRKRRTENNGELKEEQKRKLGGSRLVKRSRKCTKTECSFNSL